MCLVCGMWASAPGRRPVAWACGCGCIALQLLRAEGNAVWGGGRVCACAGMGGCTALLHYASVAPFGPARLDCMRCVWWSMGCWTAGGSGCEGANQASDMRAGGEQQADMRLTITGHASVGSGHWKSCLRSPSLHGPGIFLRCLVPLTVAIERRPPLWRLMSVVRLKGA